MPTNGKAKVYAQRDWRDLAKKALKETDPEKLVQVVEELCGVLQLQEAERQAKPITNKGETPPVVE